MAGVHLSSHSCCLMNSVVLFCTDKCTEVSIKCQRVVVLHEKTAAYLESISFKTNKRDACWEELLFVETCDGLNEAEISKLHYWKKYRGKMASFVPTSDLRSSDLALAESAFLIEPCSPSSLLTEGLRPLDREWTAEGPREQNKGLLFPYEGNVIGCITVKLCC